MEKVTVTVPTYNRPEILAGAVQRIQRNLVYNGPIEILVGDDGDDIDCVTKVTGYSYSPFSGIIDVKILAGPRKGLGANLNMLIQAADSELILQMDDDHYLEKPLDINQFAKDLISPKYNIGWIRLFLGTEEDLNNDDPFYQFQAGMVDRYWVLYPDGKELYLTSNRPHLKRKDFHEHIGPYKEGLKLGETETEFCHRYRDILTGKWLPKDPRNPWVAIPVVAPSFDTWKHTGDSWQKQGL